MKEKNFEAQKEALMKEVRSVLQEVESLYEAGVDNGTEEAKALKAKAKDQLNKAKSRFADFQDSAAERAGEAADRVREVAGATADKARDAARQADNLVQDKPYYAMGFAALAGLVIGVLLNRR